MGPSPLAPARAPTVQTITNPRPGRGLQAPAGTTSPPHPPLGPPPGLARSGVTKMVVLGEDHCEVTQGQSPRHPAPGASSSPGPRLPEQAGGLAQGPQTFPTTQGCPARTLVDSASGPGSRRPALCQRGLCTLMSVCAHPRALPEGCMTAQQGGFLRKSRTHTGGRESEAQSLRADITARPAR